MSTTDSRPDHNSNPMLGLGCNEGLGPLVERLRACSIDPMWAEHAEVPKNLCAAAADEIEMLRAALRVLAAAVPNCVETYRTINARRMVRAALDTAADVLRA